jgi:hypothetical protein
MDRDRTTARGTLLVLLIVGLAGPASARALRPPDPGAAKVKKPAKPKAKPAPGTRPRLIFPVVGPVSYRNDFGERRAGGRHQGNDLVAAKRSLAVAVEAGKVKLWTSSTNAGCMLYLHGASGTTYLYIHLNNDLTTGNDNRGKCIPGTAYAKGLKNGTKVKAGQPIGYVGDSGDADGIASHLHFEVHPKDGRAVSPYPYLQKARHLLFAGDPRVPLTLNLSGVVTTVGPGALRLKIGALRASNGLRLSKLGRTISLDVPVDAVVETPAASATKAVSNALTGELVQVVTPPRKPTLAAELGAAGALSVAKIVLSTPAGPPIG